MCTVAPFRAVIIVIKSTYKEKMTKSNYPCKLVNRWRNHKKKTTESIVQLFIYNRLCRYKMYVYCRFSLLYKPKECWLIGLGGDSSPVQRVYATCSKTAGNVLLVIDESQAFFSNPQNVAFETETPGLSVINVWHAELYDFLKGPNTHLKSVHVWIN